MCIDKKERNTSILKLGKYEYKYLSPAVYKIKNIFYLLYCNRLKSKNFYGEINIASSKDLFNWKKENIKILPPYKGIYTSLVSPSLVSIPQIKIPQLIYTGQCSNLPSLEYIQENYPTGFAFKARHKSGCNMVVGYNEYHDIIS